MKNWIMALGVTAGLIWASQAQATFLPPDGTTHVITSAPGPSGSVAATFEDSFSIGSPTTLLHVKVREVAILEAGGSYDFAYQITNFSDSKSSVMHLDTTTFAPLYFVDASNAVTATPGFTDLGTVGALTGMRSSGGAVTLDLVLAPGTTSEVMVLRTNASDFDSEGNITIRNGHLHAFEGTLEPAGLPTGAPEPSTLLLGACGLIGLAGSAAWRRWKGQPVVG
jgi:hypothetical protein